MKLSLRTIRLELSFNPNPFSMDGPEAELIEWSEDYEYYGALDEAIECVNRLYRGKRIDSAKVMSKGAWHKLAV